MNNFQKFNTSEYAKFPSLRNMLFILNDKIFLLAYFFEFTKGIIPDNRSGFRKQFLC